jgi:hypothetical protein
MPGRGNKSPRPIFQESKKNMKVVSQVKAALGRSRRAMNVLWLSANVADTETITIGNEVYEIDTAANPGAITAGRIRVNCNAGVTPTIASAAIVAAINANTQQGIVAVAISVNEILIHTRDNVEARLLACTETLAGANNAWAAAAMYGGGAEGVKGVRLIQRAANAQEVSIGNAHFVFGFPVNHVTANVRTAAGVAKAWDGAITVTGNRVKLDNAGASDWAATDILTVIAAE